MCPPLICSFGRPVDLEKDDYQRWCATEHCPCSTWMHLQCFYGGNILVQFSCKWPRAAGTNAARTCGLGFDLARFCSCRCGQGHLKKDTDWYPGEADAGHERKSGSENTGGLLVRRRRGKSAGPKQTPEGPSHEPPPPAFHGWQNSQEEAVVPAYGAHVPRWLPGQSPPTRLLHPLLPTSAPAPPDTSGSS